MRRPRTRSIRFALAALLTVLVAGVAATVANALAFDDEKPCRDTQPLFVCPEGAVGTPYSIQLIGRGGCAPFKSHEFRVLSGSLPPGLSLSVSGVISGQPTASGTYRAWLELADPKPAVPGCDFPATAQREFSITIIPGLRITTNSLPANASVGQPYSATLEAQVVTNLNPVTGAAATGATWSVVSGVGTGLPPGLSLANGVISGTPTTEGTFTFRIQATLNSASHFQTYTLTVRQPLTLSPVKPLATPPLPTLWEVRVPFSAKLTPAGGSGTYTFAIAEGSLPTGLTLAADGTVAGTPRTAGVYRATIRLSDTEGRTADYAANFGVAQRLAVSTVALRPGKVGRLYRARVTSTGGVLPRTWRILRGPLPKGVRFDRTLGVLSGTPRKAGRYRVTFQVTDGLKVVATKTLRIDILPTA